MSFKSVQFVWMNGECIPWKDATVHVSAHALHYGSGVFEGIRCYETADGPAAFRLDAHLDRLYASAAAYRMPVPYSKEELAQAICETISRNGFSSCYVRPICFRGSSTLNVHPRNCPAEVVILAWPWGQYLGEEAAARGARITVSPWRKFHSQMMPALAKACGQYVNSILAVQDAVERGFDEALLLNAGGNIAEGSGENIFLLQHGKTPQDGKLVTNGESDSILLGITRDCVLQFARDLGWQVEIRSFSLEDLLESDEAFFTGTAVEVTSISEVDGLPIGGGRRGPLTETIQKLFAEATSGKNAHYRDWLHPVTTVVSN